MEKRRLTLADKEQPMPYRAPKQRNDAPLLTLERAIADSLTPLSLRRVAQSNRKAADGKNARLERQAANLIGIAERLELYYRVADVKVAA